MHVPISFHRLSAEMVKALREGVLHRTFLDIGTSYKLQLAFPSLRLTSHSPRYSSFISIHPSLYRWDPGQGGLLSI